MNNQNHISEELLWQYADKLLSNQERLEIDNHLQSCDDCRLELEEMIDNNPGVDFFLY